MNITISEETYKQLIKHLEINAETDASAKILLEKIKVEAQPNPKLSRGAFIIDGNSQKVEYSV